MDSWPLVISFAAFAAAIFVEIVQASLPQYAVSHLFNPATFAIFSVGCLQIPLVDFAASPTSDVMMVKMQERLAEGRKPAVLAIWHDTTWKLALLFFPLVAFCVVAAKQIIVLLFTAKYAASASCTPAESFAAGAARRRSKSGSRSGTLRRGCRWLRPDWPCPAFRWHT